MTCKQPSQRGFVLVLTLWVLVVVALAAGYFAERVSRSVDLAQQSNLNTRAMIDMASSRAELLYRLATTSITVHGLGRDSATLYLDNRPYQGLGKTIVQVQDNRGLLNLNAVEDERMQRLLGLLGIPADQRPHLIDTWRDFTDDDDLHRLNGAEKDAYLARNLPPPPNRALISPWEAQAIMGWRDAPQLWQYGRLAQLTTTSAVSGLNPNTAPPEILATLPGMTEDVAQRIYGRRQLFPINNLMQLADLSGLPIASFDETVSLLPGNAMRITQSAPDLPWAIQYNVTLTPKSDDAPWQIDYFSRVPAGKSLESKSAPQALPPRSLIPPEDVQL